MAVPSLRLIPKGEKVAPYHPGMASSFKGRRERGAMEKEDFERWKRRRLWTLGQAACLICGVEPPDDLKDVVTGRAGRGPSDAYADLKDSMILGDIQLAGALNGDVVNVRVFPHVFLSWAKGRGYVIPNGLQDLVPNGCPEKVSLWWLDDRLIDAKDFAKEALARLQEIQEQIPPIGRETFTTATSGISLVRHWIDGGELTCYRNGTPLSVSEWQHRGRGFTQVNEDVGDDIALLHGDLFILRNDLIAVIRRYGMKIPAFLMPPLHYPGPASPPKPITRLDGNNTPALLPGSFKFEKPNWEQWRRIDITRLWKAACLVVNIEPPELAGRELWAEYQLVHLPPEFQALWEAVNWDEELSRLEVLEYSGRMLWKTSLPGFANWAIRKGFSVPTEMREIASQANGVESLAQAAKPEPSRGKGVLAGIQRADQLRYELSEVIGQMRRDGLELNTHAVIKQIKRTVDKGGVIIGIKEDGLYYVDVPGDVAGADDPNVMKMKDLKARIGRLLKAQKSH